MEITFKRNYNEGGKDEFDAILVFTELYRDRQYCGFRVQEKYLIKTENKHNTESLVEYRIESSGGIAIKADKDFSFHFYNEEMAVYKSMMKKFLDHIKL